MMKRVAVLSLSLLPLAAAVAHADTQAVDGEDIAPPSSTPELVAPPAEPPPPAAQAPVQPAPQNENWNDVSHINGVPVKVGERHEYLYRYKKVNVSVDPFTPFWGYYEGAVSYAVGQNLAVTGSFAAWSRDGGSTTGYQISASMPIYFRKVYSGLFIEPGIISRSSGDGSACAYDASGNPTSCNGVTHTWFGPMLLLGWHWNFDMGLNVSIAAGVAKHISDSYSDGTMTDSPNDPDFNGYIRVGYNF